MRNETLLSLDGQTCKDFEVLMVHTPEWDPSYAGACDVADKLNRLASVARGRFLAVLCDDDLFSPIAVETYSKMARASEHRQVLYSAKRLLSSAADSSSYYRAGPWTTDGFRQRNPVEGFTAAVHADLWEAVGGMDGNQLYQDWDFFASCFAHEPVTGTAVHTDFALWVHRLHDDQVSQQDVVYRAEALRRLRAKHPWMVG